jgi:hypothetical protein
VGQPFFRFRKFLQRVFRQLQLSFLPPKQNNGTPNDEHEHYTGKNLLEHVAAVELERTMDDR